MSSLADRLAGVLAGLTTTLLVLGTGMALVALVLPGGDDLPGPAYASIAAAEPVRLIVPSLGIDAPIVPIQVSADAVLDPPNDPDQVGWWDASAQPGAGRGQTVVTGHTVHTGGGAMDRIGELEKRGFVDVRTSEGTMRYRVLDTVVASREEVAEDADGLFGQDRKNVAGARLVLVTCTDWNGSFYENNVIVFARPLGQPGRGTGTGSRDRQATAAAAGD